MPYNDLATGLREFIFDAQPAWSDIATVDSVQPSTVTVRLSINGSLVRDVIPIGSMTAGDLVHLLRFSDGVVLALGSFQVSSNGISTTTVSLVNDGRYYTRELIDRMLALKMDLGADVISPRRIQAQEGTIAGWEIQPDFLRRNGVSPATSMGMDPAGGWPFWSGQDFPNRATAPFRVNNQGQVWATQATISGTITALAGAIGGFSIQSNHVRDSLDSFGLSSVFSGADDVRFWAGTAHANRDTAPFRVTEAGLLFCTAATIIGNITATGGAITGMFRIGADAVSLELDGGNKRIRSSNYAAGLRGFNLNVDGSMEVNSVQVRGEFRAAVFTAQEIHATGGSQYLAKAATVLSTEVTTI